MQNRYTGDIGDFGKFLLLKHLFPGKSIVTIWYLYPDESHNTDGSHTVEEGNTHLYRNCHTIDPDMAERFNAIHAGAERHVGAFEQYGFLENGSYFTEQIVGEGEEYRNIWRRNAGVFIEQHRGCVVCLDPDNGIEPVSMNRLSRLKQGKYATFDEVESFFAPDFVEHLVIYQHFNRLKKHQVQMEEAKERFERLYEGRGSVDVIRHNPVQARFYILLSKTPLSAEVKQNLCALGYGGRPFFSFL